MRTGTLALTLAASAGLCFCAGVRADITLNIASAAGSDIAFTGYGSGASFAFNNNGSGQGFEVTGSSSGSGPSTAVGLYGTIGGTYSYTTTGISPDGGGGQYTTVTSSGGTLTITDANGVTLTGSVSAVDLDTNGTDGSLDVSGSINLTNLSYSGSNQDLVQLLSDASANGGTVLIGFSFNQPTSLTQLAAAGASNTTSYNGMISASSSGVSALGVAPEPSSVAIAGLGSLGLIAYALRRRRVERK